MKLTNNQIYTMANQLTQISHLDIYIPAKANFFIQKNISTIAAAAQEIDVARLEILKRYGKLDEQGQHYTIPAENSNIVNQEFNDLFNIEQELDIKTFSIEALGNTEFTTAQMQAIMFMIED